MDKQIELIVEESSDSNTGLTRRLDQFLAEQLTQLSRAHIQKLIASGMVLVSGKVVKSSHRLKNSDLISVTLPAPVPVAIEPEDLPLDIVYEDEFLAVINKPAGMVTHPGAGVYSGTLVHALMHHMQGSLSGISGELRPGIVHRLDKDTSGLLVIAKEDQTHRHLAKQIQMRTASRIYTALLEGQLKNDTGTIAAPIARHPSKRIEMAIVPSGRPAESRYRVIERSDKFVLAEISLATGRTHQIRVHMASLNCPVVGDLLYNHKSTGSSAARKNLGLIGQALHATKLRFHHPQSGQLLEFEAKLPSDFAQVIDRLFPSHSN